MTPENRTIALYLALLAFHIAHVFEEIWGRFWLMNAVFGMGWYLIGNWLLFCIPLFLFYFYLLKRLWAGNLSMVYAAFMVLNGVGHNAATLITGKYFDGFAGGFSGIGLILCGIPLLISLWKSRITHSPANP